MAASTIEPGHRGHSLTGRSANCPASRTNAAGIVAAMVFVGATLSATLSAMQPGLAQQRKSLPIIPGGNAKAPINIEAARLDFFDKESKLIYSGGVIARQGTATLKASKLTIFLAKDAMKNAQGGQSGGNDSGDQVRRMEAVGPVTITSKDQVGTGNRGVYDKAKNRVYLIGNPVLTQGPNVVRGGAGAQLIYDLNTSRARITGGRVQSIIVPKGNEAGSSSRKTSRPVKNQR